MPELEPVGGKVLSADCRKTKKQRFETLFFGGGSLTRLQPQTKGLVKKRMTVEEYLEHQPEEEMADSKQISNILDSEMDVWFRVHWRLSEELFLFWYIWLKDNTKMVEEFVGEMMAVNEIKIDDKQETSEPKDHSANFDVSD